MQIKEFRQEILANAAFLYPPTTLANAAVDHIELFKIATARSWPPPADPEPAKRGSSKKAQAPHEYPLIQAILLYRRVNGEYSVLLRGPKVTTCYQSPIPALDRLYDVTMDQVRDKLVSQDSRRDREQSKVKDRATAGHLDLPAYREK